MPALSASAASIPALNMSSLIPLAVIAFVVYLMSRNGLQIWQAIVCLIGPDISSILSQFSGGYLH